jgi:hypothetical protein
MFFGKGGIFNFSGNVSINNVSHSVTNSMTISDGKVIIDGVDVTQDYEKVSIVIHGDVKSIEVGVCKDVTINGNTGSVTTRHGSIKCGDVTGDVDITR